MEESGVENPVMQRQQQRVKGGAGQREADERSSREKHLQESIALEELPPPPDHLLFSMVATIFFLPLGIAAILQCVKIRKAMLMADSRTAHYYARKAMRYSLAAVFLGSNIAVAVLTVVLCFIYSST